MQSIDPGGIHGPGASPTEGGGSLLPPAEPGPAYMATLGLVPTLHALKTPRDVLMKWDVYAAKEFGQKYILAVHDYLDRFWSRLMDIPVLQITQEQVHDVHVELKALGWSPESFNKAINAFSCLATYAKDELGWFHFVPFKFKRESTEDRRVGKFLRKNQIVPFLRTVAALNKLHVLMIVAMMLGLALRECEALTACWSKFSYDDNGHLVFTTLGKNNKERQVPVPEWLEIMIRRYEEIVLSPEYRPSRCMGRPRMSAEESVRRAPSGTGSAPQTDWMFPGRPGRPHYAGFSAFFVRKACKLLKITGITPHRLRATGANVLKLEGLSLDAIQKLLGHSRITTTILYLEQDLSVTREVQNTLGAKLWPGVPSAIQELRQKDMASSGKRLLPPPKEVVEQVGQELALIDTPAMRLLPPETPVDPVPPPRQALADQGRQQLLEAIQELPLRPRPTRPTRSQLEKLVWLMPTTTLAEIFAVTDSAIGKWCAEDGISKPGRGYWAKSHAATASLRHAFGHE